MSRVIVKDTSNTQVAIVHWSQDGGLDVQTSDASVRGKIERVIALGRERGLVNHSYRRAKTPTGIKYTNLGRWVKPVDVDFPQALADYLVNEDLIAYVEEDGRSLIHRDALRLRGVGGYGAHGGDGLRQRAHGPHPRYVRQSAVSMNQHRRDACAQCSTDVRLDCRLRARPRLR